jgi:hypothetical protein
MPDFADQALEKPRHGDLNIKRRDVLTQWCSARLVDYVLTSIV